VSGERDPSLRDRYALAAAVILPVAIAAVLVPFRTTLPNTEAALVLVVAVVGVAAFGNRVAGLLAAVGAAVWFDFFLTKPYERFEITHRADVETTILLLVVGAAVTEIAVRGRKTKTLLSVDESYLDALRETSEGVAAGMSTGEVVAIATRHLTKLLELRSCRFERWHFGGLPRMEQDGSVRIGDARWDVERRGMPARPVELMVSAGGGPAGRFVLEFEPRSAPPLAVRQVAVILARQVGATQLHGSSTGV
jgi:Domain of unknown function (DUF4118)